MKSWWELGEWSGHTGNRLEVLRLTCAFCKEQGNLALPSGRKSRIGGREQTRVAGRYRGGRNRVCILGED